MSDAAVRTARATDATAIGEIQADVWRSAYVEVVPPELLAHFLPERFADVWRGALQSPPSPLHRVLIATEGERPVGFAALVPLDEAGTAQLAELDVRPADRGRGHGSRLLNASIDTLAANDVRAVEVWPLAADEPLREFLQRAGFAPDGAWRDREVAGDTAREVRLVANIDSEQAGPDEHDKPHEHLHEH